MDVKTTHLNKGSKFYAKITVAGPRDSFQGSSPIIPAQQKPFIALVDRILAANAHTDTSAYESQIDALVYRLYSLSSEEIAVVERCK